MKARSRCVLLVAAGTLLLAVGCGSTEAPAGQKVTPVATPGSVAIASVQPSGAPPVAASRVDTVSFANLPAGSYPVHLHAHCDARSSFHIAVIGTLNVAANGQGAITVPGPDFDHGWCLIVYGSASLQSVLTTRSI